MNMKPKFVFIKSTSLACLLLAMTAAATACSTSGSNSLNVDKTGQSSSPTPDSVLQGSSLEENTTDTTPPVIYGQDLRVAVNTPVRFDQLVTVTDDTDPHPTLRVDASDVDLSKSGVYPIRYIAQDRYGNVSTLTLYITVEEVKGPEITGPNEIEVPVGGEIDYASLVKVSDKTGEAPALSVDFSAVDLQTPGRYEVIYAATDLEGNTTRYTLTVIVKDVTPPVISGSNFAILAGSSVSYKKQVTVEDDCDPDPTISVDNSAVDLDTPGTYPVIYTATDASGNTAQLTLKLTVLANDGSNEEEFLKMQAYVKEQAQNTLASIIDDSMNSLQQAYAIYYWTKNHIAYSGSSTKTNYIVGAYEGFKNKKGDCYTYFAVSKALLEEAGIDNIDMVKERTSETQARHYWSLVNVGDGWYHFDTTRFSFKESNFFMVTDAELKTWDAKYYQGAHNYLPNGLPEMATKSIQHLINYSSSKLTL